MGPRIAANTTFTNEHEQVSDSVNSKIVCGQAS